MTLKLLQNLHALLVTNPTNIRYLTGFVGAAPEEREAYVLVTKSQGYLFTNALYRQEAIKLTQNPDSLKRLNLLCLKGLTFIEISREEPFAKKLKEVLDYARTTELGFEENDVTVAEYTKLKKELKGVTFVPTKNRIEELRMIKRSDEIANIKEAAKLTDQCFTFILSKLTPGVEEGEIVWEIESFFRKNDATLAFSPIVAFGKNSSQPHYQPSTVYSSSEESSTSREVHRDSSRLRSNDIILLDFGARVNGYCADMTRVVFIGKPKDEWRRAYQTVLKAQISVIQRMQSCYHVPLHDSKFIKLSGAQLDRMAKKVIQKAGLPPYPHSLGHGVGLAIHEIPRLIARKDRILPKSQPRKDAILLSGMVFTVEPAVYVEGAYGIRIEDLILLKKDGIELLSQSPKEMIVL